jgi:hypothetical protein
MKKFPITSVAILATAYAITVSAASAAAAHTYKIDLVPPPRLS